MFYSVNEWREQNFKTVLKVNFSKTSGYNQLFGRKKRYLGSFLILGPCTQYWNGILILAQYLGRLPNILGAGAALGEGRGRTPPSQNDQTEEET